MPTAPQTMPAMAIPPPFQFCGSLLILPMLMMPSTKLATAIGAPKNQQQQLGIDTMPRGSSR